MEHIAVYDSLEQLIKSEFGSEVSISKQSFFISSDFGTMHRVHVSNGVSLILKKSKGTATNNMSIAEAFGLRALAHTHTIQVPHVYGLIRGEEYGMVLSFVEELRQKPGLFWDNFAQKLASLHKAPQYAPQYDGDKQPYFGLKKNGEASHNFIGASHQNNTITRTWIAFFREHRIWAQCKLAESNGYFDTALMKRSENFCSKLDVLLNEPESPSLLHGDLWAGNFLCDAQGEVVLIDPATYYGHYEAEIAFTKMFGGFHDDFYHTYHAYLPLDKEYHNTRKSVYNLYHILNHMNLFGSSYYRSAVDVISRFT